MRNTIIVMFVLTLGFATGYSAFSTNITLNAKGNIKQKSRTMQSWPANSYSDFHNPSYRENIVNISFLDTSNVPNNAEESWDVSQEQDKGVMAYININEEDHTKYDLFIGAKDGVIANKYSSHIFYAFSSLQIINFNENYDTSDVIGMTYMFGGGNSLEELDLSSFDTSNVTSMYGMFTSWRSGVGWKNNSLSKIIFSEKFVTVNVTNMADMFSGQPLTVLDLSSFDTSNVTNMFHMFYACVELSTVYASDKFNTTNVTNSTSMFHPDSKLEGGNGTLYNSNHTDKEYARIDTSSTPGYFTLKQLNS